MILSPRLNTFLKSAIRTRAGCNRKLHFINKPFIGLVTSGNIFLFYMEERFYIISSEHMSSHPFFRTRHFYCKACESHMLLFCKKRMLKSASFDADPNIYYRTEKYTYINYRCKIPKLFIFTKFLCILINYLRSI